MDWGRRHMLQWSHKAYRLPDRQSDANEIDQAMTDSFDHLRERLAALSDLRNVSQLLDWDQQTMMPPRGAPTRAEAAATIQGLSHDMFISDQTGRTFVVTGANSGIGWHAECDRDCAERLSIL